MSGHFLVRHPAEGPAGRPRTRISAGIVHREVVLQRVVIGPRDLLDQLQLIGVWQTAIREPEVLIETARVGHERVAVPLRDRSSVEQRILVVSTDLTLMAAAVGVDDPVVVVAAADQHEDALARAVFDELQAGLELELTRAARW